MSRRFLHNQDDGSGNGVGNPPDPQAQGVSQQAQPITLDVLKAVLAENNNSVYANTRRMVEQMNKPAAPASKGKVDATPAPAQQPSGMSIERYEALSDEMDGKSLRKEVKQKIRSDFRRENPDDVGSWFANQLPLYAQASPTPQTPEPTNSEPLVENPRPTSNGGAPAQVAGLESNDPAWTLSPEAVANEVRKRGMVGAGQALKSRLRNDMRGRSFSLGARRK